MTRSWTVLTALGVMLAAGCGASPAVDPATGSSPTRPSQTWTKDYARTTCTDWLRVMSADEQWLAAADLLQRLNDVRPSDAEAHRFATAVTGDCEVATLAVDSLPAAAASAVSRDPSFRT